jgi:3-deoxy-alpha-D-manno-octulosonate 8-oxidase
MKDFRFIKNTQKIAFGKGILSLFRDNLFEHRSENEEDKIIFLIDGFFEDSSSLLDKLRIKNNDTVHYISTDYEPTTEGIDGIIEKIKSIYEPQQITCVVGVGGGITLDTAKAVSNLLKNGGKASDYQGWDLVKQPGVYKIGIPTLSGTGAEASRTCVMTNKSNGLKLGMNSEFTVYDKLFLDPDLTATVPRNQFFYTGMDAYIHCIESLNGFYRNAIGDAFSRETLNLCKSVFSSHDMTSDQGREDLMVASYLGGCAIATSYVGLVHPFSAGLSVVLGLHHCVANCIVMRAMEDFYPASYEEFWKLAEHQRIEIPANVCKDLTDKQYNDLIQATIIHERPLSNALGANFRNILTDEKVIDIFKKM